MKNLITGMLCFLSGLALVPFIWMCAGGSSEEPDLEFDRPIYLNNETKEDLLIRIVQLFPKYEYPINKFEYFDYVKLDHNSRQETHLACHGGMGDVYEYIILIFPKTSEMPWIKETKLKGCKYFSINPGQQDRAFVSISNKDIF